jgi:hypothetical protein
MILASDPQRGAFRSGENKTTEVSFGVILKVDRLCALRPF